MTSRRGGQSADEVVVAGLEVDDVDESEEEDEDDEVLLLEPLLEERLSVR